MGAQFNAILPDLIMKLLSLFLAVVLTAFGQTTNFQEEALRYFIDLLKLDTSNPPGNETRVARYLKSVCDREGIPGELLVGRS